MFSDSISRRSFISGGSCAAAVAGIGALGSFAYAEEADFAPVQAGKVTWAEEADVVVVGYGGAGAAAAIEAAKAGAHVVLFEMRDIAGGSTIANGGFIMMGGTKLQEKFGIEDSVDNFYAYLCAAAGEHANAELIKVISDASPDLYDWCVECGMDFESGVCNTDVHLGGYNAGISLGYSGNEQSRDLARFATPAPRGHLPQPSSSGFDIFSALSQTVDSLGVDVRLGLAGKRLVMGEDGRVAGIVAEGRDGEVAIRAKKAVVLTAGGFSDNAEMVADNYTLTGPLGQNVTSAGNENGSGILMGQAVGAATRGMGCFQVGITVSTAGDALARCIIVDGHGRRIVAEDEYNSYICRALSLAVDPHCFLVINEQDAAEGGAGDKFGDPLLSGGTLAEAAEKSGVNADVLASTVAFYNESCELGEDREFGKASKYLVPIEDGAVNVYNFSSYSGYYATLGGLKIDRDAHVLNLDGEVIPGLYAAGRNAGTFYGWYVGSGSDMADVLTFGRIAGVNAAAEEPAA